MQYFKNYKLVKPLLRVYNFTAELNQVKMSTTERTYTNYVKLLFIGMIVIWLFIKSPFNPVYENFNPAEMFSVYYFFGYWSIVTLFSTWLLFFINRSNYHKYTDLILFISVSVWYLFFIPYGYETTDTGFSLSKQWAMYHGLWKENLDAVAGTNIIGGLWLAMFGEPMLLWARVGFVLVQSLIVFFSYKILHTFYKNSFVLVIVVLMTFLTSYMQYYHTINYDNLPVLLSLISVYLVLVANLNSNDKLNWRIFISGIFYTLAIFAKITFLPVLILPLIFLYQREAGRKSVVEYFIGIFSGTVIIIALLIISGGLQNYYTFFEKIISEFMMNSGRESTDSLLRDHSFVTLTRKYLSELFSIGIGSILTVLSIVLASVINLKFKKIPGAKYIIAILLGVILYFRIFSFDGNRANLYLGISSYLLSLTVVIAVLISRSKRGTFLWRILFFFLLFVFSFLGSDLGITTAYRAGVGIFSLPFLLLVLLEERFFMDLKFDYLVYATIAVFIVFFSVKDYRPYRDLYFHQLNGSFSSTELLGIRSNPKRCEVVDSLLIYLKTIEEISDKKVFYPMHNAIFYYLTATIYPANNPWDVINDFETLQNDLQNNPPDYIVKPIHSQRNPFWPDYSESWFNNNVYEARAQKYYDLYDMILAENNYVVCFSNSFYYVYKLEQENNNLSW